MLVPMLVTVLAVSVLKEKLSAWHWLFVGGGLVGALVIVRPGVDFFQDGILAGGIEIRGGDDDAVDVGRAVATLGDETLRRAPASGPSDAIASLAPVFEGFSKAHFDLGVFGNGMKMKLMANLLVAVHNVAAAEAKSGGFDVASIDPNPLLVPVYLEMLEALRARDRGGPARVDRRGLPPLQHQALHAPLRLV